jgi:hypothetical protein
MAKKATTAAKPPTAKEKAEIEKILDEMKERVLAGMHPKTFANTAVERGLRITMRPKILRRLREGGVWASEKARALLVAKHMGQIAKLLAKGAKVDLNVADAARVAVKNDENCPRLGVGRGDWCF